MVALGVISVLTALLVIFIIFLCFIFSHSKKEFKIFLGLNLSVTGLREFFYAFLLGGGLIIGVFLLLFISSSVSDINTDSSILFKEIATTFSSSLLEEFLFRSIILGGVYFLYSQKWLALIISSILFGFAHAANPDATIISVTSNFLGGIMYGLAFLGTKHIWFPIGLHFAWNFFQGPILGFNVSGFSSEGLLEVELVGSKLLTGGDYGLEASLIGIGSRLICIIILIAWFKHNLFPQKLS